MRKKLKYTKYSPKSVAPSDAARPRARTGVIEKPAASASSALLSAKANPGGASAESPGAASAGTAPRAGQSTRTDVSWPKRLCQSCCPRARLTKAFGVPR